MIKLFATPWLALVVAMTFAHTATAQMVTVRAGSESSFGPSAGTPCFDEGIIRNGRAASRATALCVPGGNSLRAETFVTSGPGVLAVDGSAEVKIIVAHFQVDTTENAPATSYIPIKVVVPVSWAGRFFNMTVFPAAIASQNMYLRLRETDAADPNVAGQLISQTRFQGASHGGISSCISIPTDGVSAATALVGCGLASTEKEEGSAFVQLSGVIRTNQPYSVELVSRSDLTATLVVDPINGYVPERVNFSNGFGMTWSSPATLFIGTDAHAVVGDLREELETVKQELAQLRHDFDGHTHAYLTGRGPGHNNTEAETPPPILPAPEAVESAPSSSGNAP